MSAASRFAALATRRLRVRAQPAVSKNGSDYVLLGAPQPLYPTPAPGSLPLFSHSWRVLF
jgi:hypothetical protein